MLPTSGEAMVLGMDVKTDEEKIRVLEEYELFELSNSVPLLRYSKYLIDIIKKSNAVIGPGRGSSCSLYCLYLIGLHRIDSLKYKLSYFDFFKGKFLCFPILSLLYQALPQLI